MRFFLGQFAYSTVCGRIDTAMIFNQTKILQMMKSLITKIFNH